MRLVIVTVMIMVMASFATGSDTLDLTESWRFQPDEKKVGEEKGWYALDFADDAWAVLRAGIRWEDQGFPDVDGVAWYRRWVDVPRAWQGKKVWLVFGAVNDACVVYCNGERVNAFGERTKQLLDKAPSSRGTTSLHMTPVIVDLTDVLRTGQTNLIAVELFDWGNNGGLVRSQCALTTDPAKLPMERLINYYTEYERGKLTVDVDLAGLGLEWPETMLCAKLFSAAATEPLAKRTLPITPGCAALFTFTIPDPRDGVVYRIEATAEDSQGKPIAGVVVSVEVEWPERPGWSGKYQSLKVLNNFVTELLRVSVKDAEPTDYRFLNPRDGWVFISVAWANEAGGVSAPHVVIDDSAESLIWRRNPDTGAFEAMRLLAEGRHQVRVKAPVSARLDIRTIPEIAYCYYPAEPRIKAYGPFDWDYVTRYVLPHVNTIITTGPPEQDFKQWLREGRQWIANAGLPGLKNIKAPEAEAVYKTWAANMGMAKPGYSGIMVDEFLTNVSSAHYDAWGDAVQRLHDNPKFADRTFYAWSGGNLFITPDCLAFCRQLMDMDYRISWERYHPEEPTLDKARRALYHTIQLPFKEWQDIVPGIERRLVMCLGYLCAPPVSLNRNPAVDYHVFLDMQFRLLATDPELWGMYGIMEYSSRYVDGESLRYAHKLFRHYCIEGNRSPLNNDPYHLTHIKNPDFADGLTGWCVEPAEEGAVAAEEMEGFSYLHGRYPRTTAGDKFCWMKRSTRGPNRVSQTIRSLKPGRAYSLKLISADLRQLDKKQKLALSIDIRGAKLLDEYGFQFVYPSIYSNESGLYNRAHPAYFNFHRVVFRPKGPTAELVISDWAEPTVPGGPPSQEIAFNFVEVQPFVEP